MKVIILAGGKGNRLMPITETTPKPLIKIAGIPTIDRIFQSLPEDIDEVIIVVNHLKEKVKSHVGDIFYDKKVTFVDQIDKKGTFGALLSAKDLINPGERFLVVNGDDIHNKEELTKYLSFNRSFGIQKMNMPGYHSIHVDKNDLISGFFPQSDEEKTNGTPVATGVYVLDTNIFNHMGVVLLDGEYGLPQTILAQKDNYPITAITTTKWIPINSFEDIKRAEKYFNP